MPRKKRSREADKPAPPADPTLMGRDLVEWAGERIAHAGRNYALLGRVESLRLSPEGSTLFALVRGNRPVPYSLEIGVEDGDLSARCTCSQQPGRACRHAVAALEALRFPMPSPEERSARAKRSRHAGRTARGQGRIIQKAPAQPGFIVLGSDERTLTKEERLRMAATAEIEERRQRARRERASVRPVPGDSGPPRFLVGRRGSSGPYRVTLRGRKHDVGTCTCPDFLKRELGTCKPIERARA